MPDSVTSAIGGDRRTRTFSRLVRSQVIFQLIYISKTGQKAKSAHGALTTELSFGVNVKGVGFEPTTTRSSVEVSLFYGT